MVADVANSKPFMVLPVGISFQRWAAELNIDYSTENVPIPPDEKEWKEWAMIICARNIFNNDAIPFPMTFDNWRDWACRVSQATNG